MKHLLVALVAGLAIFAAGCNAATPPSEKPGQGAPTGRGEAPSEVTVADDAAGQPADSFSQTRATYVHVAEDGVVRNAKGEAYCVVMDLAIDKATEADYPRATVDGVTYILCCESCVPMFADDQEMYLVPR